MHFIHWKRNLIVIWAAQFLSIMGFSFTMPFAPYYIETFGVHGAELNLWISLFAASTPLAMAFAAPVWGWLADRYGRRLMLLRASLSAAFLVALMGLAPNLHILIFLRLMQGLLTGTMTASQALVASGTPEHRHGLALGSLSAAVYSGAMMGAFFGGVFAEWFGYRMAFVVAAGFLLTSFFLVLFGVRETMNAAAPRGVRNTGGVRDFMERARTLWPVLILISIAAATRQFDGAFIPLLVKEIHGTVVRLNIWAGALAGIGGVAGFLAGWVLGRLADRASPVAVACWASLGAAVFMLGIALAQSLAVLFPLRFMLVFCAGGLDPLFQIWLTRMTPPEKRGSAFGWFSTAGSIGWFIAPLASGAIATAFGLRAIFFSNAGLYLALAVVMAFAARSVILLKRPATAG